MSDPPAAAKCLAVRQVFVRGLRVDGAIGVYDHEHGRLQPLIIDVVVTLTSHHIGGLRDTFNYELVGTLARSYLARGHVILVETMAEFLGQALLKQPFVTQADVSISKPEALEQAAGAGCRVVFERPSSQNDDTAGLATD